MGNAVGHTAGWSTTYLLAARDASLSEYNDAQVAVNLDGLGNAVGLARMVDVAREAAAQRRVDDAPLVQAEHVDAAVLLQTFTLC